VEAFSIGELLERQSGVGHRWWRVAVAVARIYEEVLKLNAQRGTHLFRGAARMAMEQHTTGCFAHAQAIGTVVVTWAAGGPAGAAFLDALQARENLCDGHCAPALRSKSAVRSSNLRISCASSTIDCLVRSTLRLNSCAERRGLGMMSFLQRFIAHARAGQAQNQH